MPNTRNWPVRGAHGMALGQYHTFTDWSLVPEEIPVFNPPPVRTNFVEVPGMDGLLDYTTVLTGSPNYGNREGSFNFIVLPDLDWAVAYSTIATAIHGKKLGCILDDDQSYFYSGRFWIDSWKSKRGYSRIVLNYNVDPYKYLISDPTQRSL